MFRFIFKQVLILTTTLSLITAVILIISPGVMRSAPVLAFASGRETPLHDPTDLYLMDTLHGLTHAFVNTMEFSEEGLIQSGTSGRFEIISSKILEWSPDGERLLFDINYDWGTSHPSSNTVYYEVNLSGSGEKLHMPDLEKSLREDAVWSPDGERLLLRDLWNKVNYRPATYVIIGRDGEILLQFEVDAILALSRAVWSPQGDRIALVQRQGTDDVIIIDASTGAIIHRVELDKSDEKHPVWSPDGEKIAFMSRRRQQEGKAGIYVTDLSTDKVTRLTYIQGDGGLLSWSPDGAHLAYSTFTRDASNGMTIASVGLYHFDEKKTEMIQQYSAYITENPWSPDGRYLAILSYLPDSRTAQLLEIDVYSGAVQQLTHDVYGIRKTAWRPSSN